MTGSNISQFPTKVSQDWTQCSRTMRDILSGIPISKSEIDEFIQAFKSVFDSFQFEYNFSITFNDPNLIEVLNNEFTNINAAIGEHNANLLFDRFYRELEIYLSNR